MRVLRDNGLTIVLMLATVLTVTGMLFTGFEVHNQELLGHQARELALGEYIVSGHYLSALFENWESEFLQMAAYVTLTAFLFQRGSAESKDPDTEADQDRDSAPEKYNDQAPWPVRAGGLLRTLYSYSLGLALSLLFMMSFALHLRYSATAAAAEAAIHGQPAPAYLDHLPSPQFWFESFQNWQSEFLSTAVLVVLSVFLRFRGSPESKPVAAPHSETGA